MHNNILYLKRYKNEQHLKRYKNEQTGWEKKKISHNLLLNYFHCQNVLIYTRHLRGFTILIIRKKNIYIYVKDEK